MQNATIHVVDKKNEKTFEDVALEQIPAEGDIVCWKLNHNYKFYKVHVVNELYRVVEIYIVNKMADDYEELEKQVTQTWPKKTD